MSEIYITEPTTKGKVIIHTSLGPLDVELFAKEIPKACRNFVQLCLEGYYNNSIFFRVEKNFIAQGGDPTGTGTGGESVYGAPFGDEFHTRLRFSHRGLLCCASFERNKNGSQFFFTLNRTPDLERRHTIFGKVVGDTIFNLVKFNDLDTDKDHRPHFPPTIISTEVVWNPFDDIEPRVLDVARPLTLADAAKKAKPKSKTQAVKSFSLLSFGEEAEESETLDKTERQSRGVVSADDVEEEERTAARKLKTTKSQHMNAEATTERNAEPKESTPSVSGPPPVSDAAAEKKAQAEQRAKEMKARISARESAQSSGPPPKDETPAPTDERISFAEQMKRSIQEREKERKAKAAVGAAEEKAKADAAKAKLESRRGMDKAAWKAKNAKFVGGTDLDDFVNQKLATFKSFLRSSDTPASSSTAAMKESKEDEDGDDWRAHSLKFEVEEAPEDDGLMVVDTRTEAQDNDRKRPREGEDDELAAEGASRAKRAHLDDPRDDRGGDRRDHSDRARRDFGNRSGRDYGGRDGGRDNDRHDDRDSHHRDSRDRRDYGDRGGDRRDYGRESYRDDKRR